MTTTIPPTPIMRCDSVSRLACSTATIPHTPTPANAPMTTRARITRRGKFTRRLPCAITPAPDACTRARREGLDGGHAPAGITLMAGEARAYLMRGRPVRLQSTSQTSIRNSSGRRLPAAEIRPGSLVAQSSALLRGSKAVIAALASESRRVVQAGLERALLARVRVHVRGRRPVVVVASGLRGSSRVATRFGVGPVLQPERRVGLRLRVSACAGTRDQQEHHRTPSPEVS